MGAQYLTQKKKCSDMKTQDKKKILPSIHLLTIHDQVTVRCGTWSLFQEAHSKKQDRTVHSRVHTHMCTYALVAVRSPKE